MKKLAATLFLTIFAVITVLGQAPPTLRIVTETPGLPSELFYGTVKVKPLRLRPVTNTPITIADYDFFIQQQYLDFLRRFPETGAIPFYLEILNRCNPSDAECVRQNRAVVSGNFFRSPEFQRKGNYVLFLYMVSLGQRPLTQAETSDPSKIDRPHYAEFLADLGSISTPNDDPALTNAKKDALAVAWVARTEFQAKYPNATMSNQAFVDALLSTADLTVSNRQALIDDLNAQPARKTRAQVLRNIAESPEVNDKYYKQAFVTMEYFGYLRRDPETAGYIFHNARFLLAFDPHDIENTIVRGFIESPEYKNRF